MVHKKTGQGAPVGARLTMAAIAVVRACGAGAAHAQATFWFVLPSLPMFLAIPAMLRAGVGFWTSLIAGCLLTIALYGLMVWLAPRVGIRL